MYVIIIIYTYFNTYMYMPIGIHNQPYIVIIVMLPYMRTMLNDGVHIS